MPTTAGYQSPLRDSQAATTRELIVGACVQLMESGNELTYSRVAAVAGVQERTVYRHFPSKVDLEMALWQWIIDHHTHADFGAADEDSLIDGMRRRSMVSTPRDRSSGECSVQARASRSANGSTNVGGRFRALRQVSLAGRALRPQQRAAAALQVLYSAPAWDLLNGLCGLDARAASDAVELAIRALFADLRRRAQETDGGKP